MINKKYALYLHGIIEKCGYLCEDMGTPMNYTIKIDYPGESGSSLVTVQTEGKTFEFNLSLTEYKFLGGKCFKQQNGNLKKVSCENLEL